MAGRDVTLVPQFDIFIVPTAGAMGLFIDYYFSLASRRQRGDTFGGFFLRWLEFASRE